MIIQPMLEFPGAFVCFLAVADHLRMKKRTAALIVISTLLAVCMLGGGLCWLMGWHTN